MSVLALWRSARNCSALSLEASKFFPSAAHLERIAPPKSILSARPFTASRLEADQRHIVGFFDESEGSGTQSAEPAELHAEVTERELKPRGASHAGITSASSDQTEPPPPSNAPLIRPSLPSSIKKLNRLLGRQKLGEIPEHELKEQFVRGSGPGGQAINKTSSSVSLIHLPTGIRVQAQPTRSREANRKAARRILAAKLDLMIATGSWSRDGVSGPATRDKQVTKDDLEAEWQDGEGGLLQAQGEQNDKVDRREARKVEEVAMAEKWSRQEILWEKERRRKANRAKKGRKKRNEKEAGVGD